MRWISIACACRGSEQMVLRSSLAEDMVSVFVLLLLAAVVDAAWSAVAALSAVAYSASAVTDVLFASASSAWAVVRACSRQVGHVSQGRHLVFRGGRQHFVRPQPFLLFNRQIFRTGCGG